MSAQCLIKIERKLIKLGFVATSKQGQRFFKLSVPIDGLRFRVAQFSVVYDKSFYKLFGFVSASDIVLYKQTSVVSKENFDDNATSLVNGMLKAYDKSVANTVDDSPY